MAANRRASSPSRARSVRAAILGLALACSAPAWPQARDGLQGRVEAVLAKAPPGTRFGLVVAADDGRELIAIAPDARFIPASNTKMFTTAAALRALPGLSSPDPKGAAAVRLEPGGRGKVPDVVLEGLADPRLSSAADCVQVCLSELAAAVAAKTRTVRNVIGDDSLFPDERWSPGMSWNNIPTRSGTGISALSLDQNEVPLRVFPTEPGKPPRLELLPYYEVDNRAVTVASGGATELDFGRLPGSRTVRLTGTIAAGAEPSLIRLGIDDPAHYAAWRLKTLLEAKGVRVLGEAQARHRPRSPLDDPRRRGASPPPRPPATEALARVAAPPLIEDIAVVNKVSQNLHAELLLRRLGRAQGSGSIADGIASVGAMLAEAGVARAHWDLSDGSGMSTYNRLAPRGVVRFLGWVQRQSWSPAFRSSLAVAGVDGTLANRFRGTPLQGRLFAKTGGLNATSALSGYLVAKSGRTLIFSIYANDIPEGGGATAVMDEALALVAQES